jgi:hypothetical protein
MMEVMQSTDLKTAQKIAEEIVYKVRPYCEMIEIAGSVRREKPFVKDIEVVCVPKSVESGGLFGGNIQEHRIAGFVMNMKAFGTIDKGSLTTGKYVKIIHAESGIAIDVFMTKVPDFYRQFAIRTGSSSFSRDRLAVGWSRKGWTGIEGQLYLKNEVVYDEKGKINLAEMKTITKPPMWKSEKEFFEFCGVSWEVYGDPKSREV